MTAEQLFNASVSLMFGEAADRSDYQPFYLDVLNILIAENFDINNSLRIQKKSEPLEEIPYISDLTDELTYEDIFNRQILPYGLAGYLYMEDDPGIATEYKNKYEYERQRVGKAEYVLALGIENT